MPSADFLRYLPVSCTKYCCHQFMLHQWRQLQVAKRTWRDSSTRGAECVTEPYFLLKIFFSLSLSLFSPPLNFFAIRKGGRKYTPVSVRRKGYRWGLWSCRLQWDSIVHSPGMICQPDWFLYEIHRIKWLKSNGGVWKYLWSVSKRTRHEVCLCKWQVIYRKLISLSNHTLSI
jgi:hypothetical protein